MDSLNPYRSATWVTIRVNMIDKGDAAGDLERSDQTELKAFHGVISRHPFAAATAALMSAQVKSPRSTKKS